MLYSIVHMYVCMYVYREMQGTGQPFANDQNIKFGLQTKSKNSNLAGTNVCFQYGIAK